jgi:hypothetical protein
MDLCHHGVYILIQGDKCQSKYLRYLGMVACTSGPSYLEGGGRGIAHMKLERPYLTWSLVPVVEHLLISKGKAMRIKKKKKSADL